MSSSWCGGGKIQDKHRHMPRLVRRVQAFVPTSTGVGRWDVWKLSSCHVVTALSLETLKQDQCHRRSGSSAAASHAAIAGSLTPTHGPSGRPTPTASLPAVRPRRASFWTRCSAVGVDHESAATAAVTGSRSRREVDQSKGAAEAPGQRARATRRAAAISSGPRVPASLSQARRVASSWVASTIARSSSGIAPKRAS